jgi:osmotically-inducible protein OsmY
MTNDELRTAVEEELLYEPRVDPREIAVAADYGRVTLRGTVGSLREKFEATKAAKRVASVREVDDQLQVKILGSKSRDDAELRGAVLQALTLDSEVPASVDATAVAGAVTLTGTATHHFESEEAERVASKVHGVTSIDNQIVLVPPPPSADDVKYGIKKALERDAATITVEAEDGVVTLYGTVASLADRDAAASAAMRAPGVVRVENHIVIA